MSIKMRALLALAALPVFAGASLAADVVRPPVVVAAPVVQIVRVAPYTWTGVYLGVQGGYDANRAVNTSHPALDIRGSLNGGIAGVYAGANMQMNRIVVGIDGSINADWAQGNVTSLGVLAGTAEVDWKAFLRARLGVAAGERLLLYGTFGATAANLKPIDLGGNVQGNPTAWGWTAGGGIEAALRQNLSVRLDYAYADYGDYNYPGGVVATNTSQTVMVGIAWKR